MPEVKIKQKGKKGETEALLEAVGRWNKKLKKIIIKKAPIIKKKDWRGIRRRELKEPKREKNPIKKGYKNENELGR